MAGINLKDGIVLDAKGSKLGTVLDAGTISTGVITTSSLVPPDTVYAMDTTKLMTDLRASFTLSTPTATVKPILSGTPAPYGYEDPIEFEDEDGYYRGVEVSFSDSAPIMSAPNNIVAPNAKSWSPFERDSYSARVVFPDEEGDLPPRTVCVALPTGAKQRPPAAWVQEVVEFANALLCLGETEGCMD